MLLYYDVLWDLCANKKCLQAASLNFWDVAAGLFLLLEKLSLQPHSFLLSPPRQLHTLADSYATQPGNLISINLMRGLLYP